MRLLVVSQEYAKKTNTFRKTGGLMSFTASKAVAQF